MYVCPQCQNRYADKSSFCELDGTKLQKLREKLGVGSVLADQFELRSILGRGSMGTVYRGWQRGIDRDVAIKLLRPELLRDEMVVKRFEREARSVARVQHANVVTVYVSGTSDGGVPFLVMEFVEGQVLDVVIKTAGALLPERAIAIAQQIASGLGGAHEAGIVHRDLKPANVLLLPGDAVKIVDFGIAKILQDPGDKLSRTGRVFGTPRYISPEQASGGKVDARSDIYSLGVILFRMVTGRSPFRGTGMQLLLAHAQEEPPSPREIRPELSSELEQLVLRALKKNPDERFQSAFEMAAALGQLTRTATPKSPERVPQRTLRGVAPGQPGTLAGSVAVAAPMVATPRTTRDAPTVAGRRAARAALAPEPPSNASQSFSNSTLRKAGIGGRRRMWLLALAGLLMGSGAVAAVVLSRGDKKPANGPGESAAQATAVAPVTPDVVPATVLPDAMPDAPGAADAALKRSRQRRRGGKRRPENPDYHLLDGDADGDADAEPKPTPQIEAEDDELE